MQFFTRMKKAQIYMYNFGDLYFIDYRPVLLGPVDLSSQNKGSSVPLML